VPCFFSASIEPFSAMVLEMNGAPLGLGTVTHRLTLNGRLTGYRVELENGTRLTVAPCQIFHAVNVCAPSAGTWRRPALVAPAPSGAA
jgi:hypothetical protein